MGQAYKIDRLKRITYRGKKKKEIGSLSCRYLAKSRVLYCNAQSSNFTYVNFRGSHFKKVDFSTSVFKGCDFWGTFFNKCNFKNAKFIDCTIVGCVFKDCDFSGSLLSYNVIVGTNLSGCHEIDVQSSNKVYDVCPKCRITDELATVLERLKTNRNLKKNKMLYISDKKYNHLNLCLLQNRYHDKLATLLAQLENKSTASITTYAKLESVLYKLSLCRN